MASAPISDLVGRYLVGDDAHFLPMSTRELTRTGEFVGWVLDSAGFSPGRAVLLICQFEEAAQFVPIEEALVERGLILTNAEASIYDGARAESILRRFDVAAVIGLNGAILDSMEANGADIAALLAGKVVWARPCAYERLAGITGCTLLRYLEIGPAIGIECIHGTGAHIDAREWDVSEEDGEVCLTSRLLRVMPVERLRTGVSGTIDRSVCTCGLSDPRLLNR